MRRLRSYDRSQFGSIQVMHGSACQYADTLLHSVWLSPPVQQRTSCGLTKSDAPHASQLEVVLYVKDGNLTHANDLLHTYCTLTMALLASMLQCCSMLRIGINASYGAKTYVHVSLRQPSLSSADHFWAALQTALANSSTWCRALRSAGQIMFPTSQCKSDVAMCAYVHDGRFKRDAPLPFSAIKPHLLQQPEPALAPCAAMRSWCVWQKRLRSATPRMLLIERVMNSVPIHMPPAGRVRVLGCLKPGR